MQFGGGRIKTISEWGVGYWWAWFPVPAVELGGGCWRWAWLEHVKYRRIDDGWAYSLIYP